MLKIFLVEDESIMREGLRDNMPWQQFGYEFVGEASDGEMALPLIRKSRPDVLLTDIKMPFMDGLTLSRIVAKEFPNMKIIILSGHDDFDYARQAIQIGVEQYILKPVTRETMKKVLLEVRDKIESEKEKKIYLEKFQSEMQEYEQMSRRNFFEKVFSGQMPVQDIYSEMEKLSINLDGPCFNLVMVSAQKKSKNNDMDRMDTVNFLRCQDELMHYFMRYPEYFVFQWNMNTYGILIKGEMMQMNSAAQRALQNITRIYSAVEEDYDWYVAAGQPVERVSQLADCYNKVNHMLSLRYLSPAQHIMTDTVEELSNGNENGNLDNIDIAKVNPDILRGFLENGTEAEIEEFLNNYFNSIQEALRSKLFRNYLVLNVRFASLAYVETLGCNQEDFLKAAGAEIVPDLNSSVESLKEYADKLIRQAIVEKDKVSNNRSHTILKKALEYIEENYTTESLSLNDAAAVINVSPNYFSAVFSQEMNMTFIEYVTKKRMDKAKKLLRQTDIHTAEIAMEVGYKDPHYFSFVFKKTQGCTPREYRNDSGNKHN